MSELKALLENLGLQPIAILIVIIFAGLGCIFRKVCTSTLRGKTKKVG